jgi:hypothetical protein
MATLDPTLLPGWETSKDITSLLAAGALTVTKAVAFKHGNAVTIQLTYSDASIGYIKFGGNMRLKIGGNTPQGDTGTEILWQA